MAGIYRGRTAWSGERWWMVCGCGGREVWGDKDDTYDDVQADWNRAIAGRRGVR